MRNLFLELLDCLMNSRIVVRSCIHSRPGAGFIQSSGGACGASRIGFIPGAGRLSYYKVVIQPARERKGRALDGIGKRAKSTAFVSPAILPLLGD